MHGMAHADHMPPPAAVLLKQKPITGNMHVTFDLFKYCCVLLTEVRDVQCRRVIQWFTMVVTVILTNPSYPRIVSQRLPLLDGHCNPDHSRLFQDSQLKVLHVRLFL